MATGTQLKLTFDTLSGSKTWTFKYAKPNATLANIKSLGGAMITNGDIYPEPPLVLKSAKTVTTTENEYDLSE